MESRGDRKIMLDTERRTIGVNLQINEKGSTEKKYKVFNLGDKKITALDRHEAAAHIHTTYSSLATRDSRNRRNPGFDFNFKPFKMHGKVYYDLEVLDKYIREVLLSHLN